MMQVQVEKAQKDRQNLQSEMEILLDRINKLSDMLDKARVRFILQDGDSIFELFFELFFKPFFELFTNIFEVIFQLLKSLHVVDLKLCKQPTHLLIFTIPRPFNIKKDDINLIDGFSLHNYL